MTMDEIAAKLGVSKSTVSRALSGKGRIGEETRRKIIDFASANGQTASAERNSFRTMKQTGNLGVVLPADAYVSGSAFFHECLLGICDYANNMDYNVVLTTSTANDISGIHDLVERGKVDGIILTRAIENGQDIDYLTEIGFPCALTGTAPSKGIIQVDSDNEMAAETLTSMLIGKGYRKFALLVDEMDFNVNRQRHDGFCRAVTKAGLSLEKQLIYKASPKMEVHDIEIDEILNHKVECIVCGDDTLCTRMMSKLQAEGYRIPMDVAVASLYNSPSLNCFTPSVTTVNISAKQMGNLVCKQLINNLTGRDYQVRTIMDYEILVRRSTNKIYTESVV